MTHVLSGAGDTGRAQCGHFIDADTRRSSNIPEGGATIVPSPADAVGAHGPVLIRLGREIVIIGAKDYASESARRVDR